MEGAVNLQKNLQCSRISRKSEKIGNWRGKKYEIGKVENQKKLEIKKSLKLDKVGNQEKQKKKQESKKVGN